MLESTDAVTPWEPDPYEPTPTNPDPDPWA